MFSTASIFKRMSDTPEQQYSSALDYTAAYKVRFISLVRVLWPDNFHPQEIYDLSKDPNACWTSRTHTSH